MRIGFFDRRTALGGSRPFPAVQMKVELLRLLVENRVVQPVQYHGAPL